MRDILSKVAAGSMIAGAALLVAACGGNEANNTAVDNGLDTDVYNTELPADLNDMNGMNGVAGDLNAAENAVENAAEAIDNAQSNTN